MQEERECDMSILRLTVGTDIKAVSRVKANKERRTFVTIGADKEQWKNIAKQIQDMLNDR